MRQRPCYYKSEMRCQQPYQEEDSHVVDENGANRSGDGDQETAREAARLSKSKPGREDIKNQDKE